MELSEVGHPDYAETRKAADQALSMPSSSLAACSTWVGASFRTPLWLICISISPVQAGLTLLEKTGTESQSK